MYLAIALFLLFQASPTRADKPLPSSFKSYDDYVEALIDWKAKHPAQVTVKAAAPTTLAACKKQIVASDSSSAEKDRLIAQLKDENAKLTAASAEQDKKFSELKTAAVNVYTYATGLEAEYKKLVTEHEKTVENFNAVLTNANAQIELANNRLTRQNQINNALAIYSLMPRYQPTQTINLRVSNCTAYPALCIN